MTVLAVTVGASAGLGIVVFRRLLEALFDFSINQLGQLNSIWLLFMPALGGLVVALWMKFAARPGESGLGVSGIIESVIVHGGRIGWRGSLARVVGAIFTVGTGGSAGPEDPSVQIGATIGSQIGQRLYLGEARIKTLIGCGAAAGIGAAFNAPISGVFFAVEIILGEFSGAAIRSVVLASVAGAIVSQAFLGSSPAFTVPSYELRSPFELGLYAVLGAAAAIVALLYSKILDRAEDSFEHLNIPYWLKPALGGLAVGALAFLFRAEILGTGYQDLQLVLQGKINDVGVLFLLVGLKLFATPLTIGSGGQGGLFAPSLFLGGFLGVGFGLVAKIFFPGFTAPAPAYGLVGMGAVLAGAVRAPITAILLPFEMTQDFHIILPLMFATVVSIILARRFERESIYTIKLKRRGIDVRERKDVNLMRAIRVSEAMTPFEEMRTVRPSMSVPELASMFQRTSNRGYVVLDDDGKLFGVVALVDVEHALESGKAKATVKDICTPNVITAFPDETLDDVLRHFGASDVGRIPVVERHDPKHVLGVLRRSDIVRAYSHALADKHQREQHIHQMQLESATGTEFAQIDLHVGDAAVGKLIKEMHLPPDSVIVSIRRSDQIVIPRGETQLLAGDSVIVLAGEGRVHEMRQTFTQGRLESKN